MKKNTNIYNTEKHTEGEVAVTFIRCLNCDNGYRSDFDECPICKESSFNNLKYA